MRSSRRHRLLHIFQAGLKTLRSRDFGVDLATVQDGLDLRAFEAMAVRMDQTAEGRWLLEHRPRITLKTIDPQAMRALPNGTLGREVLRHLETAGLLRDVELLPCPFVMTDAGAYAKTRWRETHDIRHVLTGLGVGIRDEIVLQAFQLGQFDNRFAKLQMLVGPLLEPTAPRALLHDYRAAWLMGRQAQPLVDVHWEALWGRPVHDLRAVYRIGPLIQDSPPLGCLEKGMVT